MKTAGTLRQILVCAGIVVVYAGPTGRELYHTYERSGPGTNRVWGSPSP